MLTLFINLATKLFFLLTPFFVLSVFLSINVGLLNLLPLPALDGGRILFVFLEFLHIPMNKRIEERIHKIGLALFLAFIFFISIQDIFNLFDDSVI